MARTRSLKPGFFTNEELASCPPLARILFAALWCIADRDGRLEDRPKRIEAEALPYDECDVNNLLDELHAKGFIIRYEVDNRKYIAIPNFKCHQRPHKESASKIPPPQQVTETPQKYGHDPENSGHDPNFSGNALRPFPPSTLPPFHPSTLSDGMENQETTKATEPNPPTFDETAEGLTACWSWYYHGSAPSQREPATVGKTMREILRHGVPGKAVDAEIRRAGRRRTEALFQFEQRILRSIGHETSGGMGQSSRVHARPGKYTGIGENVGAVAAPAGSEQRQKDSARGPPHAGAN